jgi:hypothetical protein
MIFEWSALNAIVFLSWLLTSSWVGLPVVLISGLILFSGSIPIDLMLLMSLTLVSFFTYSRSSRKSVGPLAQKYYALRFFGVLLALIGSIVFSPLIMIGLLITLPIFIWPLLFQKHFEASSIKTFLYATAIPAMATLVVLGRVKGLIKSDHQQLWDITFGVVGMSSLLLGSVMAFLKRKTKGLVISFTQAWLGLAVFLMMIDVEPMVHFAISALFCLIATAPLLLITGKQLGRRAETATRIVLFGMPGFLAYSTIYYSMKSISELNVSWIWFVIAAFLFQVLAIMVNGYALLSSDHPQAIGATKAKFRFIIVILVQLFCSLSLCWLEISGVK